MVAALVALATVTSACSLSADRPLDPAPSAGDPASAAPDQSGSGAWLRLVHGATSGGVADMEIDGALLHDDIEFAAASAYGEVTPGTRQIQLRRGDGTRQPYFGPFLLSLSAGQHVTVVLVERQGTHYHMTLVDDRTAPPAGETSLRFAHGSPDAGLARVVPVGTSRQLGPVSFRQVALASPFGAGTRTLELHRSVPSQLLATTIADFEGGATYTVYAIGTVTGLPLYQVRLLVLRDGEPGSPTATPTAAPSTTAMATETPTATPTAMPSSTDTATATATATATSTGTSTPPPSATPTAPPPPTASPSATPTATTPPPTDTALPTSTPSATPPPPTATPTPTVTASPTAPPPSATATPTATATDTVAPSPTSTSGASPTDEAASATPSGQLTSTATPTGGPTDEGPTPTSTSTATPSGGTPVVPTATGSPTPGGPPTDTPTPGPTRPSSGPSAPWPPVPRLDHPLPPLVAPAIGADVDVPRRGGIDIVRLNRPVPDWFDHGAASGLPGGEDPWGESELAPWLGEPAVSGPSLDRVIPPTPDTGVPTCPAPCGAWDPDDGPMDQGSLDRDPLHRDTVDPDRTGSPGPFAVPDPRRAAQDGALTRHTGWPQPDQRLGVYLGSGALHIWAVDMTIPGRGFDFVLERRWLSSSQADGGLGSGWTMGYERRLVVVDADNLPSVHPGIGALQDGDVLRMDGRGRVDRFVREGDGWRAPAGAAIRLTRMEDGGFQERDRRGVIAAYDPPDEGGTARLSSLEDAHGNRMTLAYDAEGRLVEVVDTHGRPISFTWTTTDGGPRIATVQDFTGRQIRYGYDVRGWLASVTGPVAGAEAPSPPLRVREYGYGADPDTGRPRMLAATGPYTATGAGGPAQARTARALQASRARTITVGWDAIGRVTELAVHTDREGAAVPDRLRYAWSTGRDGAHSVSAVLDAAGHLAEYGLDADGRAIWQVVHPDRAVNPDGNPRVTRWEYTPGGRVASVTWPEGNGTTWSYDELADDPLARSNVLRQVRIADADRMPADAREPLTTTWRYDPAWHRVIRVVGPRGHDPSAAVASGDWSPARFTYTRTLAYQEADDLGALAQRVGLPEDALAGRLAAAGVELDLGDVNGDGMIEETAGTVIEAHAPDVWLREDAEMRTLHPDGRQRIRWRYQWDAWGRPVRWIDPEGNHVVLRYFPSDDPEGDDGAGTRSPDGAGAGWGGMLGAFILDAPVGSPVPPTNTPEVGTTPSPSPAASETPGSPSSTPTGPPVTPSVSATPGPSATPAPGQTEPPSPTPSGSRTPTPGTETGRIWLPWVVTGIGLGERIIDMHGPGGAQPAQLLPSPTPLPRNAGRGGEPEPVVHRIERDALGRVVGAVDGRGVRHTRALDAAGNVVEVIRAAAVGTPGPNEPQWSGCDEPALPECDAWRTWGYRTSYRYDPDGRPIARHEDLHGMPPEFPSGPTAGEAVRETRVRDALGRVIVARRTVRREPLAELRVDRYFDASGRLALIRSPMASVDPGDLPDGSDPAAVTAWLHDGSGAPAVRTSGGLPPGFEDHPANAHLSADVLQTIRQHEATVRVERFTHDGNGNRTGREIVGATGSAEPSRRWAWIYDGFDRVRSAIDPVGTQDLRSYDAEGRLERWRRYGPTGGSAPDGSAAARTVRPLVPDGMGQPLLRDTRFDYDELGRRIARHDWLGLYPDVQLVRTPVLRDGPLERAGDGWVTTRWERDRKGRVTWEVQDDGGGTQIAHDGLDRPVEGLDSEGSSVSWHYDGAGHPIRIVERWSPRPRDVVLDRVAEISLPITHSVAYDAVGRAVRVVGPTGDAVRYGWDSLDRVVSITDARSGEERSARGVDPLGQTAMVNRPGNETLVAWDGAGRRVGEIRSLRQGGTADGPLAVDPQVNPDGRITVDYRWDANGRLVAVADDGSAMDDNNTPGVIEDGGDAAGNVTRIEWDALDQRTRTVHPNGSTTTYRWDETGRLVRVIDPNGTVIDRVADADDRTTILSIIPGRSDAPHPEGSPRRGEATWSVHGPRTVRFEYDGVDLVRRAVVEPVDVGGDAEGHETTIARDSLGRILEERTDGLTVSRQYNGRGHTQALVYPDGFRLQLRVDRLGRVDRARVDDQTGPVVESGWLGPSHAVERTLADATRRTLLNADLPPGHPDQAARGLDPLGRMIRRVTRRPMGGVLMSFGAGWDPDGNTAAMSWTNGRDGAQAFARDSLGRLVGATMTGDQSGEHTWTLDGVGHRVAVDGTAWSVDDMGAYVEIDGRGRAHDDNGNVVDDATTSLSYDFADRLVETSAVAGAERMLLEYDAFGRPIALRRTDRAAIRRVFAGTHLLEERRADDGARLRRYLHTGPVGGERPPLVAVDLAPAAGGPARYYAHLDPWDRLVALTERTDSSDPDGNPVIQMSVVGRALYDPWGDPISNTLPAGIDPWWSGGLWSDGASAWLGLSHEVTARPMGSAPAYDPRTGRPLQPDPRGAWATDRAMGNRYDGRAHRPLSACDSGTRIPGVVPDDPRSTVVIPPAMEPRSRVPRDEPGGLDAPLRIHAGSVGGSGPCP